jgi:acetyl esterase/lipase
MQNEHAPVPSRRRGHQFQEYYVGVRGSATWRGGEWAASPLLAPPELLRNLPQTLLLVPGVDIYYGENIELGKRLQEARVDVRLKIYPRAVHPFMSMDRVLPSGKQGMEDLISFVK